MPQKLPEVTDPRIVRVAGSTVTSASLEPTRPADVRTSIDRVPVAGYVKRPAAVRVVADSSALTPLFIVTVYEPALALSLACEKPEL